MGSDGNVGSEGKDGREGSCGSEGGPEGEVTPSGLVGALSVPYEEDIARAIGAGWNPRFANRVRVAFEAVFRAISSKSGILISFL